MLAVTVSLNRLHGSPHGTCSEDLGYVRFRCLAGASTRVTEESRLTEVPRPIKSHKMAFLSALRGSEEEDKNGRGSTNYDRTNDGIARIGKAK